MSGETTSTKELFHQDASQTNSLDEKEQKREAGVSPEVGLQRQSEENTTCQPIPAQGRTFMGPEEERSEKQKGRGNERGYFSRCISFKKKNWRGQICGQGRGVGEGDFSQKRFDNAVMLTLLVVIGVRGGGDRGGYSLLKSNIIKLFNGKLLPTGATLGHSRVGLG